MTNKKTILLISIGFLLVIFLGVGMSYALWTQSHTQEKNNALLSGCFSTTLTENNNIDLSNQYPVSDANGLTKTPYTFTISNTCSIAANYQINLETLSTTTVDSKFIKLSIDSSTSNLLNSYSTVDTTIAGALNSYQLKTGYLSAGSSVTYNLRLWVTEEATISDVANKLFNSKIVVNTSASHDSLADTLINSSGGKTAIAAKSTPDFSKIEPYVSSYTSEGNLNGTMTASDLGNFQYVTYGSSYTFDATANTFNITNPQSCKFSECYSLLNNMYINPTETSEINATSQGQLDVFDNISYNTSIGKYTFKISLVESRTSASYENVNVLYGDSYTFDSNTGKYSIVNGSFGKYSDIYNQLDNKYYLAGASIINATSTSNNMEKTTDNSYNSTNSYYLSKITEMYFSKAVFDSTASGMYSATDDYGTSYYLRGEINNNNISFGGFCWKAIRVNGNGTTRMIYNGTPTNGECIDSDDDTFISKSGFNDVYQKNAYVGYMYGTPDSTIYDETHKNTNNSTIKGILDTWYTNNLSSYSSKISDTLFCNDRSIFSGTGIGTTDTKYAAYNRIITNNAPILTCSNKNDRFTTDDTSIGNGNLSNPIGLITADELLMSGIKYGSEIGSTPAYLNFNGNPYWTMTPSSFGYAYLFAYEYSRIDTMYAGYSFGVRPVINLKSDIIPSSGNGSTSNPYQIS